MGVVDGFLILLTLLFTCRGGCGGHSKLALKVRNHKLKPSRVGPVVRYEARKQAGTTRITQGGGVYGLLQVRAHTRPRTTCAHVDCYTSAHNVRTLWDAYCEWHQNEPHVRVWAHRHCLW